MEGDRPSTTAQRAALLRAAHQVLDRPLVFDDPLALPIIGAEVQAALLADPARFDTPQVRPLRAYLAMRSRHAEDLLGQAVQRGVRQVVVLGAGLDTFAARNPHAALGLRVYEVDHPATQGWKRERLRAAGIPMPTGLTLTPMDFERQALAGVLDQAGLRRTEPAFFSWLGVAAYLTRPAVLETLESIAASAGPGSEIVFSYSTGPSATGERAAQAGEPWLSFFEPAEMARELRALGYAILSDLDPAQANRLYFSQRTDGLRVAGNGHLLQARL